MVHGLSGLVIDGAFFVPKKTSPEALGKLLDSLLKNLKIT